MNINRKCYLCGEPLDYYDFVGMNCSTYRRYELLKLWETPELKLMCCKCNLVFELVFDENRPFEIIFVVGVGSILEGLVKNETDSQYIQFLQGVRWKKIEPFLPYNVRVLSFEEFLVKYLTEEEKYVNKMMGKHNGK